MRETRRQLPGKQFRPKTRDEFRPQNLAFEIAGEVIRKADRLHPADAVLREALAARRDLIQATRAEVSGAVSAYYRWRGWSSAKASMQALIARALFSLT